MVYLLYEVHREPLGRYTRRGTRKQREKDSGRDKEGAVIAEGRGGLEPIKTTAKTGKAC